MDRFISLRNAFDRVVSGTQSPAGFAYLSSLRFAEVLTDAVRSWDPAAMKLWELGATDEEFFLHLSRSSHELCTLESLTFYNSENAKRLTETRASWQSLATQLEGILNSDAWREGKVPWNLPRIRIFCAVAEAQREWQDDTRIFQLPFDSASKIFPESPAFSLPYLLTTP